MTRTVAGQFRRRAAGGVVGAAVVGCATLAILLVCFALYQASQRDAALDAALAAAGTADSAPVDPNPDSAASGTSVPVGTGQARIGSSRNITFTQFATHGSQAKVQIHAADITPVPESINEFSLTSPRIDLRTREGNEVRITAAEGVIEADRKSGTAMDPDRGWLRGDVVIVIDRRTDADRAALPEEERERPDPASIMRVEMDEIRFDIEYGKVIIPGSFRLTASDVRLSAADLEVRFNEAAGRVDYLRIERGDSLELRPSDASWNQAVPDAGLFAQRRMTLVEMLRATLEKRMASQQAAGVEANASAEPAQPTPPPEQRDAPPPFTAKTDEPPTPRTPVKYLARFEDEVDVVRQGGVADSRLQADLLEILRDFTDADRERTRPASAAQGASPPAPAAINQDRITLHWKGQLVVEAVDPGDKRIEGAEGSRITATGTPVRLSDDESETDARCAKMIFLPEASSVVLRGTEEVPAVVRSRSTGIMTGVEIRSRRTGDDLDVRVVGPGSLRQGDLAAEDGATGDGDAPRSVTTVIAGDRAGDSPALTVAFQNRMEVSGRFVTRTRFDFTGVFTTSEERLLDQAAFFGDVVMTHDDTRFTADEVSLGLKRAGAGRTAGTVLDRMKGRGHVVMSQGDDRLTCEKIDAKFATDPDGRMMPRTALAEGDVEASQGTRTIEAKQRLMIWFDRYHRPAPPFDVAAAHARAVKAGLDVASIDWDARRKQHETRFRTEIGARRIQASGGVSVHDAGQSLSLQAESLDCSIPDGRRIDRATVTGLGEDQPASVRLGSFTVEGATIELHAEDQWALVPGRGRMTLLSYKDLNGQKLDEPIPVVIDWQDRMEYQGRENRALVLGEVHAVSKQDTTADCDKLVIRFEDVAVGGGDGHRRDWWILDELADRLAGKGKEPTAPGGLGKQVSQLDLTGRATILTASHDPTTGALATRARLSGPRILVNLSSDASKMVVDGAGTLLLEDHRGPRDSPEESNAEARGIFEITSTSGGSVTSVEWRDMMWYDFSLDQTRFQGGVVLKHFSGEYLDALMTGRARSADERLDGRRTFLQCDRLTIDFLDSTAGGWRQGSRIGRINARSLRQFQAMGHIELEDSSKQLWVRCAELVFEKQRELLRILGSPSAPAEYVIRRDDGAPTTAKADEVDFDTRTNRVTRVKHLRATQN